MALERIPLRLKRNLRGGNSWRIPARAEGAQERSDSVPQCWNGALTSLAQQGFEFSEGLFDRIEVWRIGRQIDEAGAGGFDHLLYACHFVGRQIVHDEDIADEHQLVRDLFLSRS